MVKIVVVVAVMVVTVVVVVVRTNNRREVMVFFRMLYYISTFYDLRGAHSYFGSSIQLALLNLTISCFLPCFDSRLTSKLFSCLLVPPFLFFPY